MLQSSQWDKTEARLQLRPHPNSASLSLSGFPYSLLPSSINYFHVNVHLGPVRKEEERSEARALQRF